MKKFLIALGLGAATLAAVAPADAQYYRHDGYRAGYHHDGGRHWRQHDGRAGGYGWRYRNDRHHRERYAYYRHGHRYYGWR